MVNGQPFSAPQRLHLKIKAQKQTVGMKMGKGFLFQW